MELKNARGATDLRNMKCVCSSAGIANTCHTTEESQAIVVTPPTGSLGFIRMLLLVNVRARVRVRVRVRVGAWLSQCREQSQVSRFTPRLRFIVIIIAQHAQQRVRPHAE